MHAVADEVLAGERVAGGSGMAEVLQGSSWGRSPSCACEWRRIEGWRGARRIWLRRYVVAGGANVGHVLVGGVEGRVAGKPSR